MSESRIQRGLLRSVMVAPIEAAATIGLALVLIGLLAREGGLALVGRWAMLQAFVAIALAFDLGLTYGVNRRVATDGAADGFALVARAAAFPLAGFAFCIAVGAGAAGFGAWWLAGPALALAAGAIQLLAQWISAIQTGAHRHVWTQASTVFLNVAQFALVLVAVRGADDPAGPALALAILAARLLHLVFALALLRGSPLGLGDWLAAPRRAGWRAVREVASGFALVALALKWRIPLLRLGVAALGGDAALGVFTIAQRAPEAITRVFSSSLQTMLAGFAGSKPGPEAARLVRRGLDVQAAFCLPLFMILIALAPAILDVWIGEASPALVLTMRLMALAGIAGALAMPFFWALQAAGGANFLAALLAAETALTLALGALGFRLVDNGVVVLIAGFAALSTLTHAIYAVRATRRLFGVAPIRDWMRRRRIPLVIAAEAAGAWLAALGAAPGEVGILELAARLAAYGAACLALAYVAFR